MTIERVNQNPGGWIADDELTSSQMNQLDNHLTYGLDNRSGHDDTLSSNVTMDNGSSMTFMAGSSLVIDPSTVTISSGTLGIGAEIIGDSAQSDTLRFGLATVAVADVYQALLPSEYRKFAVKLTGVLSGNTSIVLPAVSGYSKIIDNQTTGAYILKIGTTAQIAGTTGLTIPSGKSVVVYCDGTDVKLASQVASNNVLTIFNKHEVSAVGTTFGSGTSSATFVQLTGTSGAYLKVFTDVKAGDMIEIDYRASMISSGLGNTATVSVIYTTGSGDTELTDLSFADSSGATVYGAFSSVRTVSSGDMSLASFVIVALKIKSSSGTMLIKTPLSFTCKLIRN